MKTRLKELIRAKAAERDWEIVALEVMPNHVHLFVEPHPKNSPSYVANQFKGYIETQYEKVLKPGAVSRA